MKPTNNMSDTVVAARSAGGRGTGPEAWDGVSDVLARKFKSVRSCEDLVPPPCMAHIITWVAASNLAGFGPKLVSVGGVHELCEFELTLGQVRPQIDQSGVDFYLLCQS